VRSEAPPSTPARDERSLSAPAQPLSDDDIVTEPVDRQQLAASYDGDGPKDLSIYDD
jgi:hypothetical protein